ncbi:aldehyde-activating protein [Devosia pacifica]|uniref:Aldehyde-activating protein n=1 Tax=Devosia pacifica TaxID=1335967 RepID=A0A918VV30_9HYPH|nr:GFA family protein [Devosia pacifica]GHA26983.1 aldehyde-activating protein [Devosia pacifica]
MHQGSCLCGAVSFSVRGALSPPTACHCSMCRKHHGHFEAGTDVPRDQVEIKGGETVRWYQSSERVRRGFCSVCGSSLFFDIEGVDRIGLSMGAFDTPTDSRLAMHIFVADKGDYYEIADGLPQHDGVPVAPAQES